MQSLLRKFDLFIFDWDGTLSTSSFLVYVSNLVKRRYKPWYIKEHIDEFKKERFNPHNIKIQASEHRIYSSLYEAYSMFVRVKLREGALSTLQTLQKSKKKVVLFTDSKGFRAEMELEKLGIRKYFDMVLCSEDIGSYKPYPKGLKVIVSKMRVRPAKCIYVGDMASDIITAQLAGVASCGVGGGLGAYATLKEAEPTYLFESTEDFRRNL